MRPWAGNPRARYALPKSHALGQWVGGRRHGLPGVVAQGQAHGHPARPRAGRKPRLQVRAPKPQGQDSQTCSGRRSTSTATKAQPQRAGHPPLGSVPGAAPRAQQGRAHPPALTGDRGIGAPLAGRPADCAWPADTMRTRTATAPQAPSEEPAPEAAHAPRAGAATVPRVAGRALGLGQRTPGAASLPPTEGDAGPLRARLTCPSIRSHVGPAAPPRPASLPGQAPSSPVRGQVGGDQHGLHLLHAAAVHRRVRCCHHHHLLHVDADIRGGHGPAGRKAALARPCARALVLQGRQGGHGSAQGSPCVSTQ